MTPSRELLAVSNNTLLFETVLLTTYLNIASKKKAQLPPMETKPSSEDILNAILPPREWVETGKLTHYINGNRIGKHYI